MTAECVASCELGACFFKINASEQPSRAAEGRPPPPRTHHERAYDARVRDEAAARVAAVLAEREPALDAVAEEQQAATHICSQRFHAGVFFVLRQRIPAPRLRRRSLDRARRATRSPQIAGGGAGRLATRPTRRPQSRSALRPSARSSASSRRARRCPGRRRGDSVRRGVDTDTRFCFFNIRVVLAAKRAVTSVEEEETCKRNRPPTFGGVECDDASA